MSARRRFYMLAVLGMLAGCSDDPMGIERRGAAAAQQEETMRETEGVPPSGVNKCRAYRTDEFCHYN